MTESGFIPKAPSLREALALAARMGATIEIDAGEVRVIFAGIGKCVVNLRRKDSSGRLVSLLRCVQRTRAQKALDSGDGVR
jgi:hypothetical protein